MKMPEKGDHVLIYGFRCTVLKTGTCDEPGCDRTTVTIIDPEGSEDTVHLDECEGYEPGVG